MTFVSTTSFRGQYRELSGSSVVDSGTVAVVSAELFIFSGRSVTGQAFTGGMDTLDAGNSFFGVLYNVDSLDKVQNFDNYDSVFLISAVVPPPPPPPPSSGPTGVSTSCASLEGLLLFSGNTFLGVISSNRFDQNSIANPYGTYGSQYSSTSIFNQYGAYGSQFSSTSAYNQFATDPPIIYNGNGVALAYLTTNQFKTPRVDTRAVQQCVGR